MTKQDNREIKITIVKAAIKWGGKVYTGFRHHLILDEIRKEFPNDLICMNFQGFVTSEGEFVDRTKAADIAFKAGQIPSGINSLDSYQIFKSL